MAGDEPKDPNDPQGSDVAPRQQTQPGARAEAQPPAEVRSWVDRELDDIIARKARAGKYLTQVELELERSKLEFYQEMIHASSGKKDDIETARIVDLIAKKEGRPIKPLEVPQIYWESDAAKNEYLERYYKSLNKIYREHDFQEMERQRQLRIESRRQERERRLLAQGSTQNVPVPLGQTSLPHRPIGDPNEDGLPPVHHYHSNPIIPRLPDPQTFGRTYRPDPTPIGYLRNNLLEPHEKEAIEKEYWDVIEGRNDDWLYRDKLEKAIVRFLPDFAVVPDEELKSSVRFQRYLYDRLAAKHSKRLQGLNPQWMPVLRFYKWVCAPAMVISWWMNSPYLREMENRHCFDDLSPWTSKFGIWYSDDQREYRPPNLNYHH